MTGAALWVVAGPIPLPEWAWLRLVVFLLLLLSIGALITVVRLYWRAYRAMRSAGRGDDARLTPLHVALVSSGVLVSEVALAWGLIEQLRTQISPTSIVRTVLFGVGAVLILAALAVIGSVQRRRVRFERPRVRVIVADVEQVDPGPADDRGSSGTRD